MRLYLTIIALVLTLVLPGCTHKPGSRALIDPVDTIIGTYAGTIHETDTSTYVSLGQPNTYSYRDTTYTYSITVTKVSNDSFTTSIFVSYSSAGLYHLAYNSSNFYYSGASHGDDHDLIEMTFVPSKDSLYFIKRSTGVNHHEFTSTDSWNVFTGKKQ